MRKILFAISTVATIVPATLTATDYSVSGRVTDTEGTPEMYATVRIFNQADSITPIAVAATDTAGLFSHTLADPGRYRLTIASTGKGLFATAFELSDSIKAVDMGEITLTEGDVSLDEVTVTAMRPIVKREIDRLTYDVKADPEAAASNLRDILRKVPMLTVDADGTIRINGQTNFKIYKNGRPNNAYSNNAKELFAAIPASSIKKIEVITAPGVRDDAEGSSTILNIVTDSQTMLKGVMGQVGASYYTAGNRPRADAYITSQIDRVTFNIYGNASRAPRSRGNKGHALTTTDYLESGNRLTTRQEYISPSVSGFYGIEASWEPDTLRLLTAEASGYSWSMFDCLDKSTTTLTDADGNTLQHYRTDTDKDLTNKSFSFDGAINYQRMTRRKDETITLSYNISASSTDNRYHRTYSELENWQLPYTETRSSSRTYFTEQTLQADWTRPYTSHLTLDLGAKAIFRRNHAISDIDYTGHSKTADDFIHHTTVGAAYADLRGSFGKFMVRGGIRYEYSYLSASFRRREGYDNEQPDFSHRLNDWVPTASVMWQPADAHTLKGAYQRSISRPGISYLNPTVMVYPTSVSFGNPALESAGTNTLNLEYQFMGSNINFMLYVAYRFNNNVIGPVQWLGDDGSTTYSTYGNVGSTRQFNVSPWMGGMLFGKTRFNLGVNFGWDRHSQPTPVAGGAAMVDISGARWWMNPYCYIQQPLPWKLSLSFNANYWTGNQNNAYSYVDMALKDNLWYSFTLSRSFLKDDRLNVMVAANNPFGPTGNDYYTYTHTPDTRTVAHDWSSASRSFFVRVAWRFGSLKASVRKVNKGIDNSDVVGGQATPK